MTTAKKWILIVDDDQMLRGQIHESISTTFPDVHIIEAENGVQALGKIRNQCFDLVITDMMMPKMDGKTLLQEMGSVRKEFSPRAVLVLSGIMSQERAQSELGNITFMAKPVRPADFREFIRKTLTGDAPPAANKGAKVDVAFINPFIEGALSVLSAMANVQAKRESIYVRAKGQSSGDISAIIAMNSQTFHGSMAISFEKACFLYIVSNMLGEKHESITTNNQDAAAEICNQIFGFSKKTLESGGQTIKSSIPSVIVGDAHAIDHGIDGVCLAVRFSTEGGNFTIEAIIQ